MEFSHAASLTGKILLATPKMGDPRFERAAIFICAHDENGAMGLVVNQPMPNIELSALLEQLGIRTESDNKALHFPVMQGGPVEMVRGFLLHSPDYKQRDTIEIDADFSVTGTLEVLRSVAAGKGPEHLIFMLGYAGWGKGQLEYEINDNAWLVVDATPDLLFKTAPAQIWQKALAGLGIDPSFLLADSGHA